MIRELIQVILEIWKGSITVTTHTTTDLITEGAGAAWIAARDGRVLGGGIAAT